MSMRGGGTLGGQRHSRALAVSASCVRTLGIAAASVGWWQVAGNGVVPASRQKLERSSSGHHRQPLSGRGGAHVARARRVPRAVLRRPLAAAPC